MSVAGHVSRAMLSCYSHVRMEAKRRALDEIAARQRTGDEKRKEEAERREQCPVVPQPAVIQQSTLADALPLAPIAPLAINSLQALSRSP